jgi:hypothetical protein
MLEWLFGKKKPQSGPAGVPKWVAPELTNTVGLILAYWTFNTEEQAALLTRGVDALPWPELLRLHHLNCLEALNTAPVRRRLVSNETVPPDEASQLALERCRQSAERLLLPESPYRQRDVDVWQGALDPKGERPPTMRGVLSNASLTHLGSLEVLRLDEQQRPKELTFVAFDDLQMVAMADPKVFRAARLFYDTGRADEIVFLPTLYATSWRSSSPYLRDGRMTQFLANPPGSGPAAQFGLGVGQQDFSILEGEKRSVFGITSVAQITFALDATSPRFAQKCQARGLDPDEVLRNASPKGG